MATSKSIFEKSYMIRAQAEKAAAKEFGDSWVQSYEIVQDGKKWQVRALSPVDSLASAHAVLDEQIDALSDEQAQALAIAEGMKRGDAREYLKSLHPEDAERVLAMATAPAPTMDALIDEATEVCQEAIDEIREHLDEESLDELDAGLAQAQADRIANATMDAQTAKPRFSTCEKPTKKVWVIADCMPKASRKDVIAECVRQGIAYGTARTQYQAWFKASQECMRDDIRKPHEKAQK